MRIDRITGEQLRNIDLLRDIFLTGRFVFFQSAPALRYFLANATLAVEIASVFARSTNSKFRYRKVFGTNRAMFYLGGQFNLDHFYTTPLGVKNLAKSVIRTTLH